MEGHLAIGDIVNCLLPGYKLAILCVGVMLQQKCDCAHWALPFVNQPRTSPTAHLVVCLCLANSQPH